MGTKIGKILQFELYTDTSYGRRIRSASVVIMYGRNKIIDGFKYGYSGGYLNKGDIVYFDNYLWSSELKFLVKKED